MGSRLKCARGGVSGCVAVTEPPMPQLVQMCLNSVHEKAMRMYVQVLQPVKRRRFCNHDAPRLVQICLSMVQTEALHMLKLRCPGLVQMCRDRVHMKPICMHSRLLDQGCRTWPSCPSA